MLKIKTKEFGKILKVNNLINTDLIIQSVDLNLDIPKSQKVFDNDELIKLIKTSNTDIMIYTISSFTVDNELYSAMKTLNLKGYNIYLYILEDNNPWFLD
ncbi:hypothetical protein A0H76_2706 [Hepatospora eriocheir]|uniref:Uncharacterized protein n=1 Tax=Hepatospora eriocheir TaxID=1081669 RepID=A0A1X0QAP5_9MICR|nr:hypothetical protein HERIO_1232 [Hepatospora eriocheir]ORD99914.1 hypothetical protein A0H76_2706 [Hepatospora eriocheir]